MQRGKKGEHSFTGRVMPRKLKSYCFEEDEDDEESDHCHKSGIRHQPTSVRLFLVVVVVVITVMVM